MWMLKKINKIRNKRESERERAREREREGSRKRDLLQLCKFLSLWLMPIFYKSQQILVGFMGNCKHTSLIMTSSYSWDLSLSCIFVCGMSLWHGFCVALYCNYTFYFVLN